jgi:Tfp pilus assembly protein PilV
MSRIKTVVLIGAGVLGLILASLAATQTAEDTELRDLDVTGWDCANQLEGTAQSQEARERNRMKNRWPVNLSAFKVVRAPS